MSLQQRTVFKVLPEYQLKAIGTGEIRDVCPCSNFGLTDETPTTTDFYKEVVIRMCLCIACKTGAT